MRTLKSKCFLKYLCAVNNTDTITNKNMVIRLHKFIKRTITIVSFFFPYL